MASAQLLSALVAVSIACLTSGCDDKTASRVAAFLGESPALEGMGQPPTAGEPEQPTVTENATVPLPSSHEPQYGEPGYVCVPVFAQLSCDDQGKPHHIDGAFNWID